jgi:two-component system NtrC family response regulator
MILVCDDDTIILSSLSLVLRRAGYEVATAVSPAEATDLVQRIYPKLILLDMNYSRSTTG